MQIKGDKKLDDMFDKKDSDFLNNLGDTKFDSQPTTHESKEITNNNELPVTNNTESQITNNTESQITNSDKQEFSSFNASMGESDLDFNSEPQRGNKFKSFMNKLSSSETWTKRNQALAGLLVVVMLLIGFTIYHFQSDEEDYAMENDLVENTEGLENSEEQPLDDSEEYDASAEDAAEDGEQYAQEDSEEVSDETDESYTYEDSETEAAGAADESSEELAEDSEELVEEEPLVEDTSESVLAEEEKVEDPALSNTEPYTIKKGDWLSKIAKRRLGDAMLWPKVWVLNPQIENPHLIYPGDVITVPKHSREYANSYF